MKNVSHGFSRIHAIVLLTLIPCGSVKIRGPVLDSHSLRPVKHLDRCGLLLRPALRTMLVRRSDERAEQRMRLQRLRLKLGMKLAANKMRMVRQLYHLDISSIGRRTGDA